LVQRNFERDELVAMKKLALSEVKKRFPELVERASLGECIETTQPGQLVACLGPVDEQRAELDERFRRLEEIRKRAKKIPGVTAKTPIEEGRR
jgi:antitoxin (DNA-binding transcriptional repressor) of toxin-antitoxin stability system